MLHPTPLPAKQNTTPARSIMGHMHLSSLEQSCQGTTYYKQPILLRENKTRPITSSNLKTQASYLFLNRQLKGYSQKRQKHVGPKDSRNIVINANVGKTSDTLHSQVPSHHVQQKRLLELKARNWKELAFTGGSCTINKENGSQYWSWSLPPSVQQNHHSKSWGDKLRLPRMKRHKHAKLLETIVHHIQLTKDTIHIYKVKA